MVNGILGVMLWLVFWVLVRSRFLMVLVMMVIFLLWKCRMVLLMFFSIVVLVWLFMVWFVLCIVCLFVVLEVEMLSVV